jgi:hypothetical protein
VPLPNAIVILRGGTPSLERETTTNSAGRFRIVDVPAGTYSLQVLYGEADSTRILVHDGRTDVRTDFAIDPTATWTAPEHNPLERSLFEDGGVSRPL